MSTITRTTLSSRNQRRRSQSLTQVTIIDTKPRSVRKVESVISHDDTLRIYRHPKVMRPKIQLAPTKIIKAPARSAEEHREKLEILTELLKSRPEKSRKRKPVAPPAPIDDQPKKPEISAQERQAKSELAREYMKLKKRQEKLALKAKEDEQRIKAEKVAAELRRIEQLRLTQRENLLKKQAALNALDPLPELLPLSEVPLPVHDQASQRQQSDAEMVFEFQDVEIREALTTTVNTPVVHFSPPPKIQSAIKLLEEPVTSEKEDVFKKIEREEEMRVSNMEIHTPAVIEQVLELPQPPKLTPAELANQFKIQSLQEQIVEMQQRMQSRMESLFQDSFDTETSTSADTSIVSNSKSPSNHLRLMQALAEQSAGEVTNFETIMQEPLDGLLPIDQAPLELVTEAKPPNVLNVAVDPLKAAHNHVALMQAKAKRQLSEPGIMSLESFNHAQKDLKRKAEAANIIKSFFLRYCKPKQKVRIQPVKEKAHPPIKPKLKSPIPVIQYEEDDFAPLIKMPVLPDPMRMLNVFARKYEKLQQSIAHQQPVLVNNTLDLKLDEPVCDQIVSEVSLSSLVNESMEENGEVSYSDSFEDEPLVNDICISVHGPRSGVVDVPVMGEMCVTETDTDTELLPFSQRPNFITEQFVVPESSERYEPLRSSERFIRDLTPQPEVPDATPPANRLDEKSRLMGVGGGKQLTAESLSRKYGTR
jgi:hypothetical protein